MIIEQISFPNELLENKKQYANLPYWLKHYFKKWNIAPSEYGFVARHNDEIVGLLRFSVRKNQSIKTKATLIRKDFRKQTVGRQLWSAMIETHKPKEIIVYCATKAGEQFVTSLEDEYKNIDWKIDTCY